MREVRPSPVLGIKSDIQVEVSIGMRKVFQCNYPELGDDCEPNNSFGVLPYPETFNFLGLEEVFTGEKATGR